MLKKLELVICMLAIWLSGCSRNISTPSATPIEQLFPTQTPQPTIPVELELTACVATDEAIRIREGPGTDYEAIGALAPGACITIFARNPDSSWVYIETTDHFTGWVGAWLLTIDGDLSTVSVQIDSETVIAATETPQLPALELCSTIANRIGATVTCKIETAYCAYLTDGESHSTFCTDKPYPNQVFQFVIHDEDWSAYDGLCMIVTGLLETYFDGQQGLLQILGHDRSQVSSCY